MWTFSKNHEELENWAGENLRKYESNLKNSDFQTKFTGSYKKVCISFQGDSGGPFVCKKDGRYVVRGVVSFGDGCARAESYGVYTHVYKYMGWIRSQVNV